MRKFVALGSALLAVGITHTAMTGVMRDGRHPGGHVQPVAKMKVNTLAPDKFARQVTLVADTDHSDIEVLRTFKDVMANFVKDGGKHIVLEQGSVYQEIFDAVKRGVVSLDDFKDVLSVSGYIPPEQVAEAQDLMADIFNLCLQAKDCNIHALDAAPQVATENPEMWAMITKMNMTGEAGAKQF